MQMVQIISIRELVLDLDTKEDIFGQVYIRDLHILEITEKLEFQLICIIKIIKIYILQPYAYLSF